MQLSINIDHVATLREARGGLEPDPVTAATICELAGAEGIVCHLREDRRHINDRDLHLLRDTVKTKLDLEMAATDEIIKIAIETKPEMVTLVPERREELTTEGGIDVVSRKEFYTDVVKRFHKAKIPVSLFIEPDKNQIEAAAGTGTDMIEIHTGHYADSRREEEYRNHLSLIKNSAVFGKKLGLKVNAGHGLNYVNVVPIVLIPEIYELSIGHAVVARSLFVGLDQAVRDMLALVKGK